MTLAEYAAEIWVTHVFLEAFLRLFTSLDTQIFNNNENQMSENDDGMNMKMKQPLMFPRMLPCRALQLAKPRRDCN